MKVQLIHGECREWMKSSLNQCRNEEIQFRWDRFRYKRHMFLFVGVILIVIIVVISITIILKNKNRNGPTTIAPEGKKYFLRCLISIDDTVDHETK